MLMLSSLPHSTVIWIGGILVVISVISFLPAIYFAFSSTCETKVVEIRNLKCITSYLSFAGMLIVAAGHAKTGIVEMSEPFSAILPILFALISMMWLTELARQLRRTTVRMN